MNCGAMTVALKFKIGFSNVNGIVECFVFKCGHHWTHFFSAQDIFRANAISLKQEYPSAFWYNDASQFCNPFNRLTNNILV